MLLWTIQPEEIFDLIQTSGVYRRNEEIAGIKDFCPEQYDWLADQMRKRIGSPPEGVNYPVWAYTKWRSENVKPDLRAVRWYWGRKGEKYFRIEADIPDKDILLIDGNAWDGMLNFGLLSDNEEEDKELEKIYNSLTLEEKLDMRNKNWERAFEVTYRPNDDWRGQGEIIQAVFWELKKENIRKADMFISSSKYRD